MTARFAALLVLAGLVPASAQTTPDPVASLFLGQFSPAQSASIAPGVTAYAKAARGWWIEEHCHLAAALQDGDFAKRLASLTGTTRTLFVSQLAATPQQAAKQVQQIQVLALEQMTNAKFYACGEQARTVLREGYAATSPVK